MPMPDAISHYRIVRKLGEGGMGEVYLADDTALGRKVAIKLLRPDTGDDHATRRLIREAKAAATLDHPQICTIYEVGQDAGRTFIVMQYVEGETLDRLIGQAPLSLNQALAIAVQIAEGLAEAHRHGVTHRDIKPANIIVKSHGQAKLMDFGLASVSAGAESVDDETRSALTSPGAVLGTLPYMSPEQVQGKPIDSRSDIFSLGATIYEAITGQRVFGRDSSGATASAILTDEPAPLARFAASVPDELQRIVSKCLEKTPELRYQSAKDLAIDLRKLQTDPSARSVSRPARSDGKTGPAWRLIVPGVVLVLVVAAGGAYWLTRERPIDSIAVLPFENVNADPDVDYLSDGITESLINSLSQLPRIRMIAQSSVFRYKGRPIDPRAIGRELGVRALVLGRVVQHGDSLSIAAELVDAEDNSRIWGEQYNRRLSDILTIEQEISRQMSDHLRMTLTGDERKRVAKRYTDNPEAYQLYLKGRHHWNKRSLDEIRTGIEYFNRAIDVDPNYALAYAGVADSYGLLGYSNFGAMSARDAMPRAKAAAERACAIDDSLAEGHASLARIREVFDWDWRGAEAEYRRAIDLNANYATAHHWYGLYLVFMGRFDEGLAEVGRAQQIDPLSPIISTGRGWALYFSRRYDQSIAQHQKTLELDANFPMAHWGLGLNEVELRHFDAALADFQKAIDLSHGDPVRVAYLAHGQAVAGHEVAARALLAGLQKRERDGYFPPILIAMVYAGLRDHDQAFAWLERAYLERAGYMELLATDPVYDGLRSDARFADLLRRTGLPTLSVPPR